MELIAEIVESIGVFYKASEAVSSFLSHIPDTQAQYTHSDISLGYALVFRIYFHMWVTRFLRISCSNCAE